ncbi:MAG: GNAT family N-acetyltransferase [Longimicrobiales bacterium]
MAVKVVDNPAEGRFEADIDGELAVAEYHVEGDAMVFTHTEVPQQFRAQGVAMALAEYGLDAARARSMKVVPRCRFIAAYIEKHPEYQDLVRND